MKKSKLLNCTHDELVFSASSEGVRLNEVEKQTILMTLEATKGNKSEAARRLGITRKTLHKKLKNYGVMLRN